MVVSATATSLLLETANPGLLLIGAVAGLLPDVDISTSVAGRTFPWVSHWLERRFPHRSCTHSLVASAVVCVVFYGCAYFSGGQFLPLAHAVCIGYFFGWLIDVFTKSGVEMFWPSPARCVCPGNRKFRLTTGSAAEYGLLIVVVAVAIISFNINIHGGLLTEFNRLIASPSGVEDIYRHKGSDHLIVAHIQGVRSLDNSPIKGDFTIITDHATGFIVQSPDGKIYKVGSDSTAQIITQQITADESRVAFTQIKSFTLDDNDLGATLKQFDNSNLVFVSGQLTIDDPQGVQYTPDPFQFPCVKLSGSTLEMEVAPLSLILSYFRNQYAKGYLQLRIIHEATASPSSQT
jgi:inner membrane protein